MASKSTKASPMVLTEADRHAVGEAREAIRQSQAVLRRYGLPVDIESDNPLDDVSYEQRNCRMKALELAVARKNAATAATASMQGSTVEIAQDYYEFIWRGNVDADF